MIFGMMGLTMTNHLRCDHLWALARLSQVVIWRLEIFHAKQKLQILAIDLPLTEPYVS